MKSKFIIFTLLVLIISTNVLAESDGSPRTQAEEAYVVAKTQHIIATNNWLAARSVWQLDKTEENKQFAVSKAKIMLESSIQKTEQQLNLIKQSAVKETNLENKEEIIRDLNNKLRLISEKKPQIQQIETLADLTSTSSDIKQTWETVKTPIKRSTGQIINSKVLKIMKKLEGVFEKIDIKIALLEKKNYELEDLPKRLKDLKKDLEQVKNQQAFAKFKFDQISNIENTNELFKEGTVVVKEIKVVLKNIHKETTNLVKDLKKIISTTEKKCLTDKECKQDWTCEKGTCVKKGGKK